MNENDNLIDELFNFDLERHEFTNKFLGSTGYIEEHRRWRASRLIDVLHFQRSVPPEFKFNSSINRQMVLELKSLAERGVDIKELCREKGVNPCIVGITNDK